MSIYPNPAKNFFTEETGQSNSKLTFHDVAGKQVYPVQLQSSKQNIRVAGIRAGVHVVVVEKDGVVVGRSKIMVD
jgi:hypothetical protein